MTNSVPISRGRTTGMTAWLDGRDLRTFATMDGRGRGVRCGLAVMASMAIAGCTDAHLPPLSATVHIEEDGRRIGSPEVFTFSYAGRDMTCIVLDGGARLCIDADASLAEGVVIPFSGDPGVLPRPPLLVTYELPPGMGGDIIFVLCRTDSSSEGGMEIEARSRDVDGDLDGLAATLRVRFVGCTETDDGIALGDVTFVVELPGG